MLDLFSQRAATKDGQLQVSLAANLIDRHICTAVNAVFRGLSCGLLADVDTLQTLHTTQRDK